ncbi:hypothetical protein HETIRDRAFT_436918 [Heterobasidion irregulare TC 32-1]|uniref:Uncharacterized protein n=1 Tax=Heterobasidion irregulare (strain TC 32-1) TaxID=747525 RepID=W4JT84_HETIT|nr:uncharacterized protein HETIRDRAFT_436918 [Heterobasidion irregulare TC 32-1]ETW76101.1 hypothetical protein HETIRDRAFT_436918 [Heterobasidion irregulare TC 32-1]
MSLSVSSFPETTYTPPQGPGLSETLDDPAPIKRRRIFGNLFGKDGPTMFKVHRRQHAAKDSLNLQIEDIHTPVVSFTAQDVPPHVADLSSSRKPKLSLPILDVGHQPASRSPTTHHEQLVFPPTPTATQYDHSNPMKESIKSLRLSRIYRPIDVGRKDEESLPPWASRGVIASFGDPDDYVNGDREKEVDRDRTSSLLTPLSSWSTSSTRLSRRPSGSSAPSSRTSSMYFSSIISAMSSPSSASTRPRTGTVPVVRKHTNSDAAVSKDFRPVSISSENSTRTTASSPPRLTGVSTMRLRSLSTSSAKGDSKTRMKPALTIVPPMQPTGHKRSRTLSNASDKGKARARTTSNPSAPSMSGGDRSAQRPRTRTLSNTSDKGKAKARISRADSVSEIVNSKNHPPVPPLPIIGMPSTSANDLRDGMSPATAPISTRATAKSPSRSPHHRTPQPPKSAPSSPSRKTFGLPLASSLPSSSRPLVHTSATMKLYSPAPISASTPASAQSLSHQHTLSSQLRGFPRQGVMRSRSKSTVESHLDRTLPLSPSKPPLRTPNSTGLVGYPNTRNQGVRRPFQSSADKRLDEGESPSLTVATQDAGQYGFQERNIGDVIPKLRGMRMK